MRSAPPLPTPANPETVGEYLGLIARIRNRRPHEISKALRCSPSEVTRLFKGEHGVSLTRLGQLRDILEMDADQVNYAFTLPARRTSLPLKAA